MIPTIFPADYIGPMDSTGHFPTFPPHGVVDLIDCIECMAEEIEDENGSEWELAFTYPVNGYGYSELAINAIVVAKANDHQDPQAFRIYSIEKNIAKTVTVSCQHISYDLVNIPVKNYKATDAASAISGLQSNAVSKAGKFQNRFYITTDIVNSDDFALDTPTSMRAALLDGEDSIKGTYGGDLIFDNYRVDLKQVGGEDRDVTINYGVDLIDMTQEENISEMVTGILGYYRRSTGDTLYESDPIIYANDISYGEKDYIIHRIEPVDLTEHFPNNVPTPAEVKTKADQWVAKEKIGEPEISLTVQYATLGQDVRIHDAICVKFPKLFSDPKGYKAKVVKYKYNVLLERCEEIEVGHAKAGSLFNLMDASKLRKGLIPPARIQNESITNAKIAKGGVGKGKIAPQAVSTGEIETGSINSELLSKKGSAYGAAVTSAHLSEAGSAAGAAVTGVAIASNTIIARNMSTVNDIGGAAILGAAIANRTIVNRTLSTVNDSGGAAVSTNTIRNKAVTGGSDGKIAGNTVTTSNTATGINTSLANADNYAAATVQGTSSYPSSFRTGTLLTGTITVSQTWITVGNLYYQDTLVDGHHVLARD